MEGVIFNTTDIDRRDTNCREPIVSNHHPNGDVPHGLRVPRHEAEAVLGRLADHSRHRAHLTRRVMVIEPRILLWVIAAGFVLLGAMMLMMVSLMRRMFRAVPSHES